MVRKTLPPRVVSLTQTPMRLTWMCCITGAHSGEDDAQYTGELHSALVGDCRSVLQGTAQTE